MSEPNGQNFKEILEKNGIKPAVRAVSDEQNQQPPERFAPILRGMMADDKCQSACRMSVAQEDAQKALLEYFAEKYVGAPGLSEAELQKMTEQKQGAVIGLATPQGNPKFVRLTESDEAHFMAVSDLCEKAGREYTGVAAHCAKDLAQKHKIPLGKNLEEASAVVEQMISAVHIAVERQMHAPVIVPPDHRVRIETLPLSPIPPKTGKTAIRL